MKKNPNPNYCSHELIGIPIINNFESSKSCSDNHHQLRSLKKSIRIRIALWKILCTRLFNWTFFYSQTNLWKNDFKQIAAPQTPERCFNYKLFDIYLFSFFSHSLSKNEKRKPFSSPRCDQVRRHDDSSPRVDAGKLENLFFQALEVGVIGCASGVVIWNYWVE